jgi:hypothetical protein
MNKGLPRVTFSERSMAAPERALPALYGQYPTLLVWYFRADTDDRAPRTELKDRGQNCSKAAPQASDPQPRLELADPIPRDAQLRGLVVLRADEHAVHSGIELLYERGIHNRGAVDANETPRVEPGRRA